MMSNVPNSLRSARSVADAGGNADPKPARADARQRRLRRLVDDHLDLAARMIRNVGVPDGAVEDLAQQAFAVCASRIDEIEPGKDRTFLVQTALRLAANARREWARAREVATGQLPDIADQAPSPEEKSDQLRRRRRLDLILDAMDLDERTVFLLYEVEEMTMAEIAGVLEIPAGTVASRLRRAREDFLARANRSKLSDGR